MPRYKLTIEYQGTGFVGWQRQENGIAIQQLIEEAFHGFCGEKVLAYGMGRTDSGVHALGMVAHVDLQDAQDPEVIKGAVNFHLKPNRVAILNVEEVPDDFHARHSAVKRHYLYRIHNRHAPLTLTRDHTWFFPRKLNVDAMHDAAQILVGHHDFTSFRNVACQAKSPIKTLDKLDVKRVDEEIHITASARSFLYNQIRNFVGTLALVGEEKWTKEDLKVALDAKDRTVAGPTAPPEGLYFVKVEY